MSFGFSGRASAIAGRAFLVIGLWVATAGLGLAAEPIRIGNTIPYSGPLSSYGTVGHALAAYFDMVNDQGGIHGRRVEFVTADDGYSPPRTVEQVRRLIERDQVLLLFSNAGTPTNTAVHEYVNARAVPHLFLFTGASKWGAPETHPWSMGYWPSYATEGAVYGRYLLRTMPDARIGVLYQNDDYGRDYLDGLKQGLGAAAQRMIVAEQPFETTDPTIDAYILNLKNSGATVLVDIATNKHAAQAIRSAHDSGWRPLHVINNVATSVETVLKPAGLQRAKGLITAAFLKDPTDPQWADAADFRAWSAWMDRYYPAGSKDDILNAYAYGVGFTMATVLKQCGDDLSPANIMRQAASLKDLEVPMLLPGIRVNTGPDDFFPIESLRLMRFDGREWVLFGDLISG